ncbi:MAG TPA: arginyltransferase [Gammaproteobacteria bacterium]|jgi:arginine-tRNA-protein transferase
MSRPHESIPTDLLFYASEEHPCSYLPGEDSVTLFADPKARMTPQIYSALSDLGFRRSGEYVYAPRCPRCHACLPVRLPVAAFKPDRSQRRNMAMNRDLAVRVLPARFDEAHFALYQRYIHSRHPDGSMATPDREQYNRFFSSSWSDTRYVEFSLDGQPLAVAVVDLLERGLSAVYTFFEPAEQGRGLGVFAVLWLIEEVKRRGLPYLYLGYLIHESPKMAYKARYRPLEVYRDGSWKPLD